MKKITQILPLACMLLVIACNKDHNSSAPISIPSLSLNASKPYQVTLIAGGSYADGTTFLDGKGDAARFGSMPGGIFETSDKTLYFADTYNHAIRKITSNGTVTTLHIPSSLQVYLPYDVYLSQKGALYISYIKQDFQFYLGRAYANGSTIYVTVPNNQSQRFFDLEAERTTDSFLAANYPYFYRISDNSLVGKQIKLQSGTLGSDDYDYREGPGIQALATSQTGDRYFIGSHGKHIYLKDSENRFKQVFKSFTYSNITSIAVSADGKEIYITDDGSIKKISGYDNSIVTLVKKVEGNTQPGKAGNGVVVMDSHVPLYAYANHLTISHDGNYLYFTSIADFSTTINKVRVH